jgi:hypothetical protein
MLTLFLAAFACEENTNVVATDSGPSGRGGAGGVADAGSAERAGAGGAPEEPNTAAGGAPSDAECIQSYGGAYHAFNRATAPDPGDPCEPEGIQVCVPTSSIDGLAGYGFAGAKRLSECSGGQWRTVDEDSSCRPIFQSCNAWAVQENFCCGSRGAYCRSDASPPVVAVCDGTRWYELETPSGGGTGGGTCTVALEDMGEVVYWVEDCPATYEAAEALLDSCEGNEEMERWSGGCDGYVAATRVWLGAHGQTCYYDASTRRLVGAIFESDVPEFCGSTSSGISAGRYPEECPSRWNDLESCAPIEATAGAGGAGGAGGIPIAGAAGKAEPP